MTTATLAGSMLSVIGTDFNDQINFQQTNGAITIQGVSGAWVAKKVKSIVVDLRGGDDFVSLASLSNGGNQNLATNITVYSGSGNDQVHLANGHDFLFAAAGNTVGVSNRGVVSVNGAGVNWGGGLAITLAKKALTIVGTNANDSISLKQVNGLLYVNGGGGWALKKVASVSIYLQEGTDTVSLDSLSNGGN